MNHMNPLVRALVVALAVVHAGACDGHDVSCYSLFQQDLQVMPMSTLSNTIAEEVAVAASLGLPEDVKDAVESVLPMSEEEISKLASKLYNAKAHAKVYAINVNNTPSGEKEWAESNDKGNQRVGHVWHHDVFPDSKHSHIDTGDEGMQFFKAAPFVDWMILLVVVIVLIVVDAFGLRRLPSTLRWHVAVIGFWVLVAAGFNIYIWKRAGHELGVEWASGYILEWMLSVDNLFVFHLVLQSYKCPEPQVQKAVMIGIVGAVGMRLVFFMVVSTLLRLFTWFRYPFGALLIWSGIEAARSDDDDDGDLEDTRMVKMLRWCLGSRLSIGYDEKGHGMFTWDANGRLQCTMLFVVLFVLEASDLLFALDSVSAKVAQIPQQYIAFSSSVLAMFGLRAMFFVVRDLVEIFEFLKYGICLILVFIGLELVLSKVLELASLTVCMIIVSVFVLSMFASFAKTKVTASKDKDEVAAYIRNVDEA